ncbi:hypothetical protein C2G38_2086767, partial [Gigaspora rosea]
MHERVYDSLIEFREFRSASGHNIVVNVYFSFLWFLEVTTSVIILIGVGDEHGCI